MTPNPCPAGHPQNDSGPEGAGRAPGQAADWEADWARWLWCGA